MADSLALAFAEFDRMLRPDAADREETALERELVRVTLAAHPRVERVIEAGSWSHGTAVRGSSRFDLIVVLAGPRPRSSARVGEL
ncbi:MAG: hypothetical protein Q7T71_17430, partial [Herbiconiux sp.]|nr:hypothetical protein [Herbiconiux sp.]